MKISHVVAGNEDYSEVISSNKINIVDSYVETKATTELREGEVIKQINQLIYQKPGLWLVVL